MTNELDDFFDSLRIDPKVMQQSQSIIDATEEVCRILHASGMTRAEFAKKIGKSKSHLTQLLDGTKNITLRTLSDLFYGLGYTYRLNPIRHGSTPILGLNIELQELDVALLRSRNSWIIPTSDVRKDQDLQFGSIAG